MSLKKTLKPPNIDNNLYHYMNQGGNVDFFGCEFSPFHEKYFENEYFDTYSPSVFF